MNQVREELQQLLRAKSLPHTNLSAYPALVEYIRVNLSGQIPDRVDVSRLALALVFEAALRPGPTRENDRGEPAYPLRAAKHLLALGDYPDDLHAEIPDTGMSLYEIKNLDPKNPTKASDPRGPHTLGLRAQIAALASKYGESRGVLLKEGSKRLGEVVTALQNEMHTLVAYPNIVEFLQAKIAIDVLPTSPDPSNASIDAILRSAMKQVDRSPSRYPSAMRPTLLAVSMTVSPVSHESAPLSAEDSDRHLYSHRLNEGGTPALATLASKRRSVLLGDPGAGKSTILAARYADYLQDDERNTGAFARLSDVGEIAKARPPKSPSEAVAVVVEAFALWSEIRMDEATLSSLSATVLGDPRALIALDGLDEVRDPVAQQAVIDTLRNLDQVPGVLLLTSRFTSYSRPLESLEEFAVDRLAPEQIESFLSIWYPKKSAPGWGRVRAAMSASPHLRDLMRTPIMAVLVAFVADREAVPLGLSALYNRYIELFLERRWKAPNQRRHDAFEIANLVSLAADVAWEMAVGSPIDQASDNGGDRWTDTIVAAELVEIAGSRDTELRNLISVDGLLTLHGSSHPEESILQRRYRWLHRTVHEHLVGVHLARLMRSDPEAVIDFIIWGMQGLVPIWEVEIQHAIGQMRPFEQDLVLKRLRDKIAKGDPGGLLSRLVLTLAKFADSASRERQEIVDQCIEGRNWFDASLIDLERTKSALRAGMPYPRADHGMERLFRWGGEDGFPPVFGPADRQLVESLVSNMNTEATSSPVMTQGLRALADIDPLSATNIWFEHLRKFPDASIGLVHYGKFKAPDELVAEIRREALEREFPANLSFVRLLRSVHGPGLQLGDDDFLQRPAFCVAYLVDAIMERGSGRLRAPKDFLEGALAGRFGNQAAFEISKRLFASEHRQFAHSPWAEVGEWISALWRARPGLEEPNINLTIADTTELAARFQMFSGEDISSPVRLTDIMRSLVAFSDMPTQEQMVHILQLWLRATRYAESPAGDLTNTVCVQWVDFLEILEHTVIGRNKQMILPILRSGALDLHGYLEEAFWLVRESLSSPRAETPMGEAQILEIFDWGRSIGLPLLPAIPYIDKSILTIEGIFDHVDHTYLGLESNRSQLAHWLWDEGIYPVWRDRLLTLGRSA